MESLDPRIKPLNEVNYSEKDIPDQLKPYEVFIQLNKSKPFTHVGVVHAADLDLAFLFAKEQYSRRLTCSGIWVMETADMYVSELTDGDKNVFDLFTKDQKEGNTSFHLFILNKRGKQQVFLDEIQAKDVVSAISLAYQKHPEVMAYHVWVCESNKILKMEDEVADIWNTLNEKGFRDASAYRAGDKLKNFLAKK